VLPVGGWGELWVKVLDTTLPGDSHDAELARVKAGQPFPVEARSVVLLRRV